jgi:hypothetical protein
MFLLQGELVGCAQCQKRFHPICAAKKKFFCARSNRVEWKFYCDAHAPTSAVYDVKRQSWVTLEILNQLRDLRYSLERGRMLLEMSRQRDRQQKRLLNVAEVPFMKASVDIVLKRRPTPLMREVYESITGDSLADIPRRPKALSQPPTSKHSDRSPARNRRTLSRRGGAGAASEEGTDLEQTPHRTSARRAASRELHLASKRGREAAEELPATSSSRPKRRRLEVEMDQVSEPSSTRPTRSSSHRQSPRNQARAEADEMAAQTATFAMQQQFFESLSFENVSPDFDDVVPQEFPNLVRWCLCSCCQKRELTIGSFGVLLVFF